MRMKNLFNLKNLLALLIVFLAITGCEKEEAASANKNDLISIWTITDSDFNVSINNVPIVDFIMQTLGVTREQAEAFAEDFGGDDITGTIEFKEDGTYVSIENDIEDVGTWELINDGKQMILDKGTEFETTVTFSAFSASSATITFSETEKEDLDEDDVDETIKYTVIITLKKN